MGNLFTINLELGSIITACKGCTVGKASSLRDIEENLESLQKKLEDLSQAKDDVKRRVDLAEQQPKRRRRNQVQLWFTRVEQVETQVDALLKLKSQEIKKLCLRGFCSKDLKSSYKYGKKVVKLLKVVEDLKGEAATFVDVAERILEGPVVEMASEQTVGLESDLEDIWSYVEKKEVKIIGLYGKGGVGKTTLLTQINNKFLNLSNNFVVIWVQVSKDLRLENIQETIGKKIGLLGEWNSKLFEEKARDIFWTLSRKKFVLLLDDIWERVDLMKIGIPPSSHAIDFKVIFTTRSFDVCSRMETQKIVEVQCLNHEEAWRLFQKKVGEETLNSHADIPALAKEVAKECGGLPLALITIGRAMAGKHQLEEWEFAISILRNAAHEFPGMQDDVFCLLKLSYDLLPSDVQRSCFLYCSLFPEDFHIAKRDLVDCWISEGFLKKYDGILARNFGYNIIGFLLRACLLEEGENDNFVKMHDVIRDMALWIAYEVEKEGKFLVCSSTGLTVAPETENCENVKRMSLMENKIENLAMIPNCCDLLTLFLQSNPLRMVTSGFFQHIPHLQVLNLSKTDLAELPVGISELVALQHLDLSWTKITELPEELKALTSLKCLNLEETHVLCKIPGHVMSNLSMLRILRMFRCGLSSIESKDSILFDECELFIEELAGLKHLNMFSVHFKNSRALQRFLNSHELQNRPTESISLQLVDGSRSLDVLSLGKLKDLHTLFISSEDLVELVIDRQMRNEPQFHRLHKVQLFSCSKLRDATWLIFAPKLEILEISNCNDMMEIISFGDEVPEMTRNLLPFARLEHLILQSLERLETIYCNPLPFPHLKQIFIKGCPIHKKLPLDSNSMTNRALKIRGEQHWWNDLQWEDEATQNHFRPYFEALDN